MADKFFRMASAAAAVFLCVVWAMIYEIPDFLDKAATYTDDGTGTDYMILSLNRYAQQVAPSTTLMPSKLAYISAPLAVEERTREPQVVSVSAPLKDKKALVSVSPPNLKASPNENRKVSDVPILPIIAASSMHQKENEVLKLKESLFLLEMKDKEHHKLQEQLAKESRSDQYSVNEQSKLHHVKESVDESHVKQHHDEKDNNHSNEVNGNVDQQRAALERNLPAATTNVSVLNITEWQSPYDLVRFASECIMETSFSSSLINKPTADKHGTSCPLGGFFSLCANSLSYFENNSNNNNNNNNNAVVVHDNNIITADQEAIPKQLARTMQVCKHRNLFDMAQTMRTPISADTGHVKWKLNRPFYRASMVTVPNAYIDRYGRIFSADGHQYLHGGCTNRQNELFEKGKSNDSFRILERFDSAIILHHIWGNNFFHILAEIIPQLTALLSPHENILINRNDNLLNYIEFLGLGNDIQTRFRHFPNHHGQKNATDELIVETHPSANTKQEAVFVRNAMIPLLPRCGFASKALIQNMKMQFQKSLNTATSHQTLPKSAADSSDEDDIKNSNSVSEYVGIKKEQLAFKMPPRSIILYQRHKSRRLSQHKELLRALVTKYGHESVFVFDGHLNHTHDQQNPNDTEKSMQMSYHSKYDRHYKSYNISEIVAIQKTFENAHILIGPHGAGLTNMMWMKPNCSAVVEIMPLSYRNLCFYDLSDALNLNYAVVEAKGGKRDALEVDVVEVMTLVDRILSTHFDSSSNC